MKLADLLAQLESAVAELRAAEAPLPAAIDALEAKVPKRRAVLVSWGALQVFDVLPLPMLNDAMHEAVTFYDTYEVN